MVPAAGVLLAHISKVCKTNRIALKGNEDILPLAMLSERNDLLETVTLEPVLRYLFFGLNEVYKITNESR